jgi:hypothetical protein
VAAESTLSILVASSDGYRDLWEPFFTLFFRYWPDCPYRVYLGANEATYDDPRVTTIRAGSAEDWTQSFKAMLEAVPDAHVLVLLEDYLLNRPVDTRRIGDLDAYLTEHDGACLRVAPIPGAPRPLPDSDLVGELPVGSPYRLSLQAAIWHRESLLALLRDGESPWQLEIDGSARTAELARPFFSIVEGGYRPFSYFATAVVRGAWRRDALALCRREGVPVDSARAVERRRTYLKREAKRLLERG